MVWGHGLGSFVVDGNFIFGKNDIDVSLVDE